MTVPTIGFWLMHQVSHLLRHHAERYPVRDPTGHDPVARPSTDEQRWNVAADAEINDDLVAGRTARPEEAVTPSLLGLPGLVDRGTVLGRARRRRGPRRDARRASGRSGPGLR